MMQDKRWGDGYFMRSRKGVEVELTDRPYGDMLRPPGEVPLRSALTNAAGGDAGKVNSTKPFHGLPIFVHTLRPNLILCGAINL